MPNVVKIDHYSDVLCVWAYIAHVRTQELQAQFPNQLDWTWHYLPVFGDTPTKFASQWGAKGGVEGYAQHMHDVAAGFDHMAIHDDCWVKTQPASSAPAHLWLAAARLAAQAGELPATAEPELAWALRLAFFRDAANIAQQPVLIDTAESAGIPSQALLNKLEDGSAYAALCHDMLKARDANIRVSPTYVFNDDRQRLTGNVGYRIIEANVRELLEQPQQQQSWC